MYNEYELIHVLHDLLSRHLSVEVFGTRTDEEEGGA